MEPAENFGESSMGPEVGEVKEIRVVLCTHSYTV